MNINSESGRCDPEEIVIGNRGWLQQDNKRTEIQMTIYMQRDKST